MPAVSRSNLILGLVCVAFALGVALIWVPLDTHTGIIERVRGRYSIGDALAPTVATMFILLGGVWLALFERRARSQSVIDGDQLRFISAMTGVVVLGVLIMRYTGPALIELINQFRSDPLEYRLLRNTPGWRHVGFLLGGVFMVTGMVSIVEHGVSRRAVVTGLVATLLLIVVFDLPFEDLLLPPNGDV